MPGEGAHGHRGDRIHVTRPRDRVWSPPEVLKAGSPVSLLSAFPAGMPMGLSG